MEASAVSNPLPGETDQGVTRDASHLLMYPAFLLQMPFYLRLLKQFTNSCWSKLHLSPGQVSGKKPHQSVLLFICPLQVVLGKNLSKISR